MTSFSDAALWQPFSPPSASPLALVPDADTPDAHVAAAPAAAVGVRNWLPALSTDTELAREAEREALRDDAFQRGAGEAARAERARADARCATALEAVARAAAHLDAIAAEFARDRERDVQAVALAAARHIVQHELTIDTLRVGELVRRAVDLLPLDHVIEIRIHPDDLETLRGGFAATAGPGRDVKLRWLADPGVERGGFVIETPHRVVDGRTDVALRALYERLDRE